jgi:hypothetical protein
MSVLMDVYVGSYVAAVGGATKSWHKDFPLPQPRRAPASVPADHARG